MGEGDSDGTEFFTLSLAMATSAFFVFIVLLDPRLVADPVGFFGVGMYAFGVVTAAKLAVVKVLGLMGKDGVSWGGDARTDAPEGHPMHRDE